MSYEIVWESKGVVKRFFDRVCGAELLQGVVDIESDARFDDVRYVINDFLGCTDISIRNDVVEEIAAIDYAASKTNPSIRIAVVARDPAIVALATDYANSPMNVYLTRVFGTVADARSWLAAPVWATTS